MDNDLNGFGGGDAEAGVVDADSFADSFAFQEPASSTMASKVSPEAGKQPAAASSDIEAGGLDIDLTKGLNQSAPFFEKGMVSNFITFGFLILGVILRVVLPDETWTKWVLSFGVFGFAGGITNWLAVKMLFDRIGCNGYYLPGSGIIPNQFEGIKVAIKSMIMDTFFDKAFLEDQLAGKVHEATRPEILNEKINTYLASDAFDSAATAKLDEFLNQKTAGKVFKAMGLKAKQLLPLVSTVVRMLAKEVAAAVASYVEAGSVDTDMLRNEVDKLMDERLRHLTADKVKSLMEVIVRVHLGWLVVWGNIFGGLIGLICSVAGAGQHF